MSARSGRWTTYLSWRLVRLVEGPIKEACAAGFTLAALLADRRRAATRGVDGRIGVVVQEFFDGALGGFGGFGLTTRMMVDTLGAQGDGRRALVILPQDLGLVDRAEVRRIDGADVLLLPSLPRLLRRPWRLVRLLRELHPAVLVTIDYLPRYEYVLWAAPRLPLVIYLGDPRGARDWERIATVDAEWQSHRWPHRRVLLELAAHHRASYRRLRRWSRWLGRPLTFATDSQCLVERARDKFGEPGLDAHFLPTPMELPALPLPSPTSSRPMLLFLGRLVPQKRPWIVYELARRMPGVDFVVAGAEPPSPAVEPLLAGYGVVSNVRRVGLVLGAAKEALLGQCWALLNTSIHEGMPVSFLEAFGHARPVVSCVDPDGVVSRFGYPVGEVLGDGRAERDLAAFERAIRAAVEGPEGRRQRGLAARRFVEEVHTPEHFRERFGAMLAAERIDARAADQ